MNWIIYTAIGIGHLVGYFLLFPKAGRKSWEALIPMYNFYVLTRIIKRPWWWVLLLVFPGVNLLMLMVFNSNLATVFGKRSTADQLKAIFLPFVFLPIWGMSDLKYIGPIDRSKQKKSPLREWGDAIIFAVIAASIIRTYFLEAFTIPTGSMEKTLLIGDYLFVSKMAYGPKVPQTPLSFPFAHHTLPGTEIPSYLEWIKLPYYRLPGFGNVERNDIVVFNYPEGDTVCVELQSNRSYNQVLRDYALFFGKKNARKFVWHGIPKNLHRSQQVNDLAYMLGRMGLDGVKIQKIITYGFSITTRPVDKREHYIKRCVALPGDKIKIEYAKLFINDEPAYIPPRFQLSYNVVSKKLLNQSILKDKLDINLQDIGGVQGADVVTYTMPLTLDAAKKIEQFNSVESVRINMNFPEERPGHPIFPNVEGYDWTEDFWGPLVVPAKGATVELNTDNIVFYQRIISVYEGHDLRIENGEIYIDGNPADSYTFEMDYYFMMGDSRHNSADSRFWGFVPENHIVGKAALIWLSLDPEKTLFEGKIRFNRMFRIPE
ncbi:MAG: signal peptidase I [Salibacteraceae bacterium]